MIPTYEECMLPLLKLLLTHQTMSLAECTRQMCDVFGLSEAERVKLLKSKRQTVIRNRVGWAKFYLSKAGLLDVVSRGKYMLSQEGAAFLATDPQSLTAKDLLRFPAFAEFVKGNARADEPISENADDTPASQRTPEEIIDDNYKYITSTLVDDLLEKVMLQSAHFFEGLVVDLLMKMGYGAGKITGRSGDGGIDGIIDEDKLGLDKVHIQAKRWQPGNNVGRKELQSFVGALAGQSGKKGVFITTSDFTREAYDYNPSNVKIAKINGRRLAELMIQHNVGVTNRVVYEIKKIDTDYFEEV